MTGPEQGEAFLEEAAHWRKVLSGFGLFALIGAEFGSETGVDVAVAGPGTAPAEKPSAVQGANFPAPCFSGGASIGETLTFGILESRDDIGARAIAADAAIDADVSGAHRLVSQVVDRRRH